MSYDQIEDNPFIEYQIFGLSLSFDEVDRLPLISSRHASHPELIQDNEPVTMFDVINQERAKLNFAEAA